MKIEITNEAYLKFRYFIEECEKEISGFGKVREMERDIEYEVEDDIEEDGENWWKKAKFKLNPSKHTVIGSEKYLEIYDIEILEQTVSGAHATMTEETLAQFLMAKMMKGESTKDYKVWWHSHADFEAYFSPVDEATIAGSTEFPFLISLVGNHAGDLKSRFDVMKPVAFSSPFKLIIQEPKNERIRQACIKEIKQKVKFEVFQWEGKKKGSTYEKILAEEGFDPVTGSPLIDSNDVWPE